MEFLQAFLQAHDLLLDIVVKLEDGRMSHCLICCWIILPFNHFRIPLNSNVTNLQKVRYVSIGVWLNDASTAFIYPVASGTRVALAVDHLQDERPEAFAFSIFIEKLFPVRVIPPLICGVQILAVLFQDVVSEGPNLLIDSSASGLSRQTKKNRRCEQLRLVVLEDRICLFDESSVIGNGYQIIWQFVKINKFFELVTSEVMVVEDERLSISQFRRLILLGMIKVFIAVVSRKRLQQMR